MNSGLPTFVPVKTRCFCVKNPCRFRSYKNFCMCYGREAEFFREGLVRGTFKISKKGGKMTLSYFWELKQKPRGGVIGQRRASERSESPPCENGKSLHAESVQHAAGTRTPCHRASSGFVSPFQGSLFFRSLHYAHAQGFSTQRLFEALSFLKKKKKITRPGSLPHKTNTISAPPKTFRTGMTIVSLPSR